MEPAMECEKELFVGNLRTDVEPEFVQQKLIALFATVGVDVNADMIEVTRKPFASHAFVAFRTDDDCRHVLAGLGTRFLAHRHSLTLSQIAQPGKKLLVERRRRGSSSSYFCSGLSPGGSREQSDTDSFDDGGRDETTRERISSLVLDPHFIIQTKASSSVRLHSISEHGQAMDELSTTSSVSVSSRRRRQLDSPTRGEYVARSATTIEDVQRRLKPVEARLPAAVNVVTSDDGCPGGSAGTTREGGPSSPKNSCNSAGGGSGQMAEAVRQRSMTPSRLQRQSESHTRTLPSLSGSSDLPCTLRQCISAGSGLPFAPDKSDNSRAAGVATAPFRPANTMPPVSEYDSMHADILTEQSVGATVESKDEPRSSHDHDRAVGGRTRSDSGGRITRVMGERVGRIRIQDNVGGSQTRTRNDSGGGSRILCGSAPFTDNSADLVHEAHAYTLGEHLGNETRHREFKSGQGAYIHKQLRDHVAKYTVSFLNSEGGVLIIGVDDAGVVLGIPINQHLEDILRQKIDAVIKDISPQVFPHMYRVNFCLVEETEGVPIVDVKVIEVMVRASGAPQLYQTPRGDVYMRRDGSVQGPLKATDIQEWTRMMMREEYRSKDTEIEELRKRKIDLTSQLEAVTSRYNRDSKDLRDRLMVKRITKDGLENELVSLQTRMSEQRKGKKRRKSGVCSLL